MEFYKTSEYINRHTKDCISHHSIDGKDSLQSSRPGSFQKSLVSKALLILTSFFMTVCLFGCSDSKKAENAQTFFTALNHLLEADSLDVQGSYELGKITSDFRLVFDQKQNISLALILGNPKQEANSVQFYIKDGKTYLDYLGTTSQSVAENIGIHPGTRLNLYNPFLDFSNEERASFFRKITIEKDGSLWYFEIDPNQISALLDSYGTARVEKASMQVEFENKEIKTIQLDITGLIQAVGKQGDLNIQIILNVVTINQPVTIPYPDNLADYGKS